jgi:hypothetical protein
MGIDIAKLKEKFDRKGSEKPERLELKDGVNYIRILPPSLETLTGSVNYMSRDYLMHFGLGPEHKKAAVCARSFNTETKKFKCPICEAAWALKDKSKDPGDIEVYNRIKAKIKHLFNAIDLNNKEKGIQVLEVGAQVYKDLMLYITNPNYQNILDVETGNNITLTKSGAKLLTQYGLVPDPQKTSILSFLPANWKDVIDTLKSKIPTQKGYDELKAIMYGEDEDEDMGPTQASDAPVQDTPKMHIQETIFEAPSAPAPVPMTPPPAVSAVPVSAPVAPTPAVAKPECFGTEAYAPKRKEGVACPVRRDCVLACVGM